MNDSVFSATKACFISATVFLLAHIELIQFERELIYLCVVSMFIYVRVVTIFFKQYDPLMPFENFSSGLLFNSWSEIVVNILNENFSCFKIFSVLYYLG